jgi:hypothetical protein
VTRSRENVKSHYVHKVSYLEIVLKFVDWGVGKLRNEYKARRPRKQMGNPRDDVITQAT